MTGSRPGAFVTAYRIVSIVSAVPRTVKNTHGCTDMRWRFELACLCYAAMGDLVMSGPVGGAGLASHFFVMNPVEMTVRNF